jgi:glycine cleavage system H lipoate-binding protein
MWLDEAPDGTWHVGVDEFLAFVLGRIDEVAFPMRSGLRRPTAVLRANGVDLQMIFPEERAVIGVNLRAKYAPERIVSDPYRTGWLFEGHAARGGERRIASEHLMRGPHAVEWMRSEFARLATFAHEELASSGGTRTTPASGPGFSCPADGGEPVRGIAGALRREAILKLFEEFFAPPSGPRRRP